MADIKPSIVLEDSKGNRFFFYYKDSSIYYREVLITGDTKDTILISQANTDFAAAIDTDDAVYLTCNSRYKGVLLFIYTNLGWKFEPVVNLNNSPNIYIMDMLVQNGSIHIFFSKRLPIANLYNVYHLQKNIHEQISYIEYSWKKNSISEIYSQNIENSFSVIPSKGGIIHYASVWYDGTHYYINYYCYDDSIKYWIHNSLNISYKNQVSIKLINQNKKINLLCFSNDNEASNIHHFLSKSDRSSEIDFREINNSYVDTDSVVPLFFYDDKAIQLAWLKDHVFHQYTFDDSSGKWRKTIDLPVTTETNIHVLKLIRNSGSLSITKGYFLMDKNYNISRPIEHLSRNISEVKPKEKLQAAAAPEMNDYLKQILDEIKGLSDNVQHLNGRLENLESNTIIKRNSTGKDGDMPPIRPEKNNSDSGSKTLKKSNFKEKFMKNDKLPNYDNLLIKQENVTTFIGKPVTNKNSVNTPQETEVNVDISGKQAFVAPGIRQQNGTSNKNNGFLRKIGEFFK